jgi:hypothetical protein
MESLDLLFDIAEQRVSDLHDMLMQHFVEFVGGNRYEHKALPFCDCAVARDFRRVGAIKARVAR